MRPSGVSAKHRRHSRRCDIALFVIAEIADDRLEVHVGRHRFRHRRRVGRFRRLGRLLYGFEVFDLAARASSGTRRKMRPSRDGSTGQPFCGEFNMSRKEMLHEMAGCEYARCDPVRFNYLHVGRPCADQNQHSRLWAYDTTQYPKKKLGEPL